MKNVFCFALSILVVDAAQASVSPTEFKESYTHKGVDLSRGLTIDLENDSLATYTQTSNLWCGAEKTAFLGTKKRDLQPSDTLLSNNPKLQKGIQVALNHFCDGKRWSKLPVFEGVKVRLTHLGSDLALRVTEYPSRRTRITPLSLTNCTKARTSSPEQKGAYLCTIKTYGKVWLAE